MGRPGRRYREAGLCHGEHEAELVRLAVANAGPSARATASSHFSRAALRWETTVSTGQLFVVGKPSAATAEAIIEVAIAVMRVGLLLLVALSTQSD